MNKPGSSLIENEKRIRSVQEWLMSGQCTTDIITQCVNLYGISSRQAYTYLKKAYKEFKKISEEQIEERRSFHIEARLKLYRDLKDKNTSKSAAVAVDILKDIAKLEGLYVEKQEITMPDGLVITVNFKDDDKS
ncbi:MAG: hypothetical protein ACOYOV_05195 [Bacteroidales bacterium]